MINFIKRNYHWIIAAVALLQMLIYGGAVNNFSGYHMIPVTEALNITRTQFSLAESLRAIFGVISTFFSGALIQRFGYRKTTAAALATVSLAHVIYTCTSSYWMLIAGNFLMGLAKGFCFTAGISRLLSGWFHKYRGTVLGLVTAATGVGSTLLGFLQAAAIEHVSWRLSFGIVGGLHLLLALIVFVLVRNTPEDMGLRPFGEGQLVQSAEKKTVWEGFSMDALKKQPAYYLLCVFTFFSCMCVLATQYNIVPFFQDCGMSVTRTSKLYGIMMLMLGVFKLLMGVFCDAIGAKRVLLVCHFACAAGLVLIMLLPQTDFAMIAALLVFDLAIPMTTMMYPLVTADLFGIKAQNQYIGIIMAMATSSNIIASPIANAVYDSVGSYRPVFWVCAALALAMIPLYCLLYAMVARSRKKA